MIKPTKILGIESSCDECSASVVDQSMQVLSVATHSQVKLHQPFGGVVPEVASRNHLETINEMIDQAMRQADLSYSELDAVAVTNRPGLVGALLVGVSAAKTLAYTIKKPLVPVHHLEGHTVSIYLDQPKVAEQIQFPLLLAIISGGHTNLHLVKEAPEQWSPEFLKESLIARSRDDAAGEAFDKTAKLLGFDYPGGVWIDKNSVGGRPDAFDLPRALPQKAILDYSFSGLKTAVALLVQQLKKENRLQNEMNHVCASIQEAIVDAILKKIFLAIERYDCRSLAIVGGVAANSRLKARLESECHVPVFFPKKEYCTDNAAMIAGAGMFRFRQNHYVQGESLLRLNAHASAAF